MPRADGVEDGVQQGAQAVPPRVARPGRRWQERAHQLPFGVRQRREVGVSVHALMLLAPDKFSRPRSQTRSTVFGQLVGRCAVKRVWAHDLWHLSSHLLRKVLLHTLAVLLNGELGNPPLQLAQLVAWQNLHIGLASIAG